MYFTGPSAVGDVLTTATTTIDLSNSFTLGTNGMIVTGISGTTRYSSGSPGAMSVKLYSGTHVVNMFVPVGVTSAQIYNQSFFIPLIIPARFAGGLKVDLRVAGNYSWTVPVSDFSVHYIPLPL